MLPLTNGPNWRHVYSAHRRIRKFMHEQVHEQRIRLSVAACCTFSSFREQADTGVPLASPRTPTGYNAHKRTSQPRLLLL